MFTLLLLQDHLKRQDLSLDDPLITMSDKQRQETLARYPTATPSKQTGQDKLGEQDTPEKTPAVNLTRERPILHRSVESHLKKCKAEMDKALNAADAAHTAFKQYPSDLRANDRALLSFCRVLQFRQETVARCVGVVDRIVQLVPDASLSAAPSEQSTTAPVPAPSSPSSLMTGAQDALADTQNTTRKTLTFDVFLGEQRTKSQKFWEGEVSDVIPVEQVHIMMEKILEAADAVTFLQLKKTWGSVEKAYQQIAKGTKQAADDVTKHMKVRQAESIREKKRKQDQDAKAELQKVKDEAKAAADQIKKRKQSHEEKTIPLYTATMAETAVPLVYKLKLEEMQQAAWRANFPWAIKSGGDSANLLLADTTLQRTLSFWGSQYKKTMAQSKLQQVTYPVDDKAGLEVVNKFFGEIIPADERPDICKVAGGKAFMEAAWLFGCSSDLKQTNFTPNNAALLKMLVVGEVRHILIEWKSLVAAFKKMHSGEELSTEKVLDKLSTVDDENVTAEILFKHGATMRQCVLSKLEVMFIPMGWLCVEIAGHSSFIYGLRKSCFVKGSVPQYEDAIHRTKTAGKSVERMESILEILKKLEA